MQLLFSEENWKSVISQHIVTAKYKRCMISSTTTKGSDKTTKFLREIQMKIITVEIVMASHAVYHYQSFSSNDCLNILLP